MKVETLKKLSQYSAIATATLFTKDLSAQIIYTDINPDFLGTGETSYSLDLNNDGITDVVFNQYSFYTNTNIDGSSCSSLTSFESYYGLFGAGKNSTKLLGEDSIKVLQQYQHICDQQPWVTSALMREHEIWDHVIFNDCSGSIESSIHINTDNGNWLGGNDKYVGVKIEKDNHSYYGWVRMSVSQKTFTVKDYAINLSEDSCVYAGKIGCEEIESLIQASDTISCDGSPIQLGAIVELSIADSFQWFHNGQLIANSDVQTIDVTSSGQYFFVVNYNNSCYDTSNVVTLVFDSLQTPIISVSSDTLFSSYSAGNQWYLNSNEINGANENYYILGQSGTYQVEVTDSLGCSSISDPYNYIATSIWDDPKKLLQYFLVNKILHVDLNEENEVACKVYLSNEVGVILKTIEIDADNFSIDMANYSPGVYFVTIATKKGQSIIKFVLNS